MKAYLLNKSDVTNMETCRRNVNFIIRSWVSLSVNETSVVDVKNRNSAVRSTPSLNNKTPKKLTDNMKYN